MKKIVLILGMFFLQLHINAQSKLGNVWVAGLVGYQLNFNSVPLIHDTIVFNPVLLYESGHSNICDSNGNLLLCSDGMNVSNNTGAILDNGDTLASSFFYNFSNSFSRYSQSSIFLPMANNKYYLVTPSANDTMVNNQWIMGINGNFNLLYYHVIDMNANGGAGKVIKRMQPLLENRMMDKTQMMACRHANGKDWWLLKKAGILGSDSNEIFTFLFTQDSVYNYGMQTIPFPRNDLFWQDYPGQMKFNQAGTQMASTVNNWLHEVYIADFDRCTGKLSNFKKRKIPVAGGDSSSNGLAFSPNGRFLYVTQYSNIYQYDLQDTNQNTAWFYVHGIDTTASEFAGYTTIDLAPNGKMYIGHWHGTSHQMSVIDNPDLAWNACNFCRKCLRSISLNGVFGTAPNMPNYNLGALSPCWPLGIEDEKNNKLLLLYPNPASTMITIEYSLNENEKGQLQFYDVFGKKRLEVILSNRKGRENVILNRIENGVYFYRFLINDKVNCTGKFIKE